MINGINEKVIDVILDDNFTPDEILLVILDYSKTISYEQLFNLIIIF